MEILCPYVAWKYPIKTAKAISFFINGKVLSSTKNYSLGGP
jgi:hypothetical protein